MTISRIFLFQEFNDTYISNSLCKGISCQFTKYEKLGGGPFKNWMTWYNLFGFFWLMEFVTAFGEMVLAGKSNPKNKHFFRCGTF